MQDALLAMFVLNRGRLVGHLYLAQLEQVLVKLAKSKFFSGLVLSQVGVGWFRSRWCGWASGCDRVVVKTFEVGGAVSIRTIYGHVRSPLLSKEGWKATRLLGAGRILSHRPWSPATCRGLLGAAR